MQPPQSHTRDRGWTSTDHWAAALQLAQQCRDKFEEPVETIDDIERNSTAALELLAKRQVLNFTAAPLLP